MIATLIIAASITAPARAEQRAPQLPPIDAGSVWNQIHNQPNHFPQPAPTTLDTCVFSELKNNECYFNCQSGAVLEEPAVAGSCATHIIRPIPAGPFHNKTAAAPQILNSFGKYATGQEAVEAMNRAISGLKYAKAKVTSSKMVSKDDCNYGFQITFVSPRQLIVEPGASFKLEADAYDRMLDRAQTLESEGGDIAFTEIVSEPGNYSYTVDYFENEQK